MITLNRFSLSFHQNYRNVCGHLILVTDDIEKLDQGQNLQNAHFDVLIFLKLLRQISLTEIDNKKFQILAEFGIITANSHRRCFHKLFCFFQSGKQKVLRIAETTHSFQKCFTI